MGKGLNAAIVICLMMLTMSFSGTASAEIVSLEGVGEYYMENDNISLSKAKDEAKLLAEVDVVEQARVNVEGNTVVKNSKLTKNEITTVAAGILYVKEVKYSISADVGDVMLVKAIMKAEIDTDLIPKLVERELKKRKG